MYLRPRRSFCDKTITRYGERNILTTPSLPSKSHFKIRELNSRNFDYTIRTYKAWKQIKINWFWNLKL